MIFETIRALLIVFRFLYAMFYVLGLGRRTAMGSWLLVVAVKWTLKRPGLTVGSDKGVVP